LLQVSEETIAGRAGIQRPHLLLRFAAVVLSLAILALATLMVVNTTSFIRDYTNFIQALEASISSVVFIARQFFSWDLGNRIKRRRALKAIHELRALAHIIDMHQLTKDPRAISRRSNHNRERAMTSFELNRYLDYCSEGLRSSAKSPRFTSKV